MVIETVSFTNKSNLYCLIFLILLRQNALFCQPDSMGNVSNHSEINISAGWHATLFLDKHSIDDFWKTDLSKHDVGEYLALTYFRGTFYSKSNFCYSLDYRTYAKSVHPKKPVKGDVLERVYTAINIGFGKTIYRNKSITLTPTLYLSSRLSGGEYVLIDYVSYQSGMGASSFVYKSLGVGSGFSYRHLLYKNINLGLDLFYIHYFQKSVGYPIPPGFEDYVKNYEVNKDALILCLTLGYRVNLHKSKERN